MEAGPPPKAGARHRLLFALVFSAMGAITLAWIAFLGWMIHTLF
jgi:hypothetical protein